MYHSCLSVACGLVFTLFASSYAWNISAPLSSHALHRRAPFLYEAQGDSYAAGPGAGQRFNQDLLCQKYSKSYPNLLNRLLNNGEEIGLEAHHACIGATAEDIMKHQQISPVANMATIGVGLESINFVNVINECVYLFKKTAGCDETLHQTLLILESRLSSKVREVIQNALEGEKMPGFQIFLVGFARFWNSETDQCDQASWEYWDKTHWPRHPPETMTKDRRRKMNEWIVRANEILDGVVAALNKEGETRVHFVNYDDAFDGHRFCEENVIEPQANDEPRPEAYLFQYETSRDQPWGTNSLTASLGPAADWMSFMIDTVTVSPFRPNVSTYYRHHPVNIDGGYGQGVPIFLSKIFHPTPAGHAAIAEAIKRSIPATINDAIEVASTAGQPSPRPISRKRQSSLLEAEATCGKPLSLNFPRFFTLEDGKFTAAQILQRMRDQACSGICDAIPGIPLRLLRWQKQSVSGCEYAVKIDTKWELFFSATDAGDNCREASTPAIEQCMTEKGRRVPLRDTGIVDGPNDGESYRIGVRALNGKGSNHPAFPEGNDFLPYMHLSCRVQKEGTWRYYLEISEWNDGQNGQSLIKFLRKRIMRHFKWWPQHGFHFLDGTRSDHLLILRASQQPLYRPEFWLESFFGLEWGSVRCPFPDYYDIPVWLDERYDTTQEQLIGIDTSH